MSNDFDHFLSLECSSKFDEESSIFDDKSLPSRYTIASDEYWIDLSDCDRSLFDFSDSLISIYDTETESWTSTINMMPKDSDLSSEISSIDWLADPFEQSMGLFSGKLTFYAFMHGFNNTILILIHKLSVYQPEQD